MAKKFVYLHKGREDAESEVQNQGTSCETSPPWFTLRREIARDGPRGVTCFLAGR